MAGSAVELAVAFVSIVPETSKIAPEVRKALGGVEKEGDKAGRGLGGRMSGAVGSALKGLAKTGIAAAGAGVATAFFKGFGRLKAIEEARAKLTGLGHSAKTVDEIMKNALASVKGTAFGLGDAATAAASAVAAGIKPGKELERYLKGVGDAATIAGTDFNDMAAIFGKVAAGDMLQGDAIAQLTDRGIPILQLLGKQLGVTAAEAKKMASQGKISFKDFQKAMEAGMEGAALKSGKTVQGSFNNMVASLGRIGANVLEPFYKMIPGFLGNVTAAMGPAEDMAKQLGGVLAGALAGLPAALAQIADSPFGKWVVKIGREIGAILVPAIRDVAKMITTDLLPSFMGFINDVVNSPLISVLTAILGPVLRGLIQGVVDTVKGAVKLLSGIFKIIGGILTGDWSKAWEGVKQATVGAIQMLWGLLQAGLLGRVLGIFRVAGAAIGKALGAIFGGMGAYGKLAGAVWNGLVAVVKFAWSALSTVFGALRGGVSGLSGVWTVFRTAASGAWSGIVAVAKVAWAGLAAVFTGLKATVSVVWSGIAAVIKTSWNVIVAIFGAMRGGVSAMSGMWGILKSATSSAWGGIVTVIKVAWAGMQGVFSLLRAGVASLSGIWSTFRAVASAAWSGLTAVVKTAWTGILAVFNPLRTWIASTFPSAWNVLKSATTAVWGAISSVIKVAWNIILGIFTLLRSWADVILTRMFTGFQRLVANVWSGISTVVKAAWGVILGVFNALRAGVAALTSMWNTFRAAVAAVWNAISAAIRTVWNAILNTVFNPLRTWVSKTLTTMWTTFRTLVATVWTGILTSIRTVWNGVLAVFNTLRNWVAKTLTTMWNNFRNLVSAVWNGILGFIKAAWVKILAIFQPLRTWVSTTLTGALNTLRTTASTVWSAVSGAINTAWTKISGSFKSLRAGLQGVWDFFKTSVKGIGTTWDGLKDKVTAPIRYVVNSIIRDKLVAAWNAVAGKVGLPKFAFAGFARGGWTGPGSKHKPAGVVHADEFVVRKWARRRLERRTPGMLDHMNRTGELPGYRAGGRVRDPNRTLEDSERPGKEMGARTSPLRGAAPKDQGVWRQMGTWIQRNLPFARITSSYRRTMTATGRVSNHARGLALDIAGRRAGDMAGMMKIFNVLAATWGSRSIELIHSPAGGRQIYRGKPHMYTGVTRANHFDHVHWSMPSMDGSIPPNFSGAGNAGGSFPNPLYAAIMKLVDVPFGAAKGLIGGIAGKFGKTDWVEIARASAQMPLDQVQKFLHAKIAEKIPAMLGSDGNEKPYAGPVGAGVEQWRGLVRQALAMTGQPTSLADTVLRRMNQESRGNPNAVNNSDINAKRGDPSKGLMQVIGGTFRAHAMPGYNRNVFDPLSNILASIRYTLSRYGSLPKGYNRKGGYSEGGLVTPTLFDGGGLLRRGDVAVHAAKRPDRVLTENQWKAVMAHLPLQSRAFTGRDLDGGVHIHGDVYGDPARYAATVTTRMRDELALVNLAGV